MKNKFKKVSTVVKNNVTNIFIDGNPLKSIGDNFFDFKNNELANFLKDKITKIKNGSNIKNILFYQVLSLAVDKINNNKIEYIDKICKYSDTDLICYRADGPDDLCKLQEDMWDPVLEKLEKLNIKFNTFQGIIPQAQPTESIEILKNKISEFNNFQISCLLKLTQMTGSVLLSYSFIKGFINEKCMFECSLLDENWQAKKWGLLEDVNEKQKNEFLIIKDFNRLLEILG